MTKEPSDEMPRVVQWTVRVSGTTPELREAYRTLRRVHGMTRHDANAWIHGAAWFTHSGVVERSTQRVGWSRNMVVSAP